MSSSTPLSVVAVLVAALAVAASASASGRTVSGATHSTSAQKTAVLVARERRQERTIRSSQSTLVFFTNHPTLLYAEQRVRRDKIGRRAWRTVTFNRARIAWTRRELRETRSSLDALRLPTAPIAAIRYVFGGYADQAIRVAACETGDTFDTGARNGQYLGLFQMGTWERATYAHGAYTTPLDQARAAWRYFAASGFGWSPWECRP